MLLKDEIGIKQELFFLCNSNLTRYWEHKWKYYAYVYRKLFSKNYKS